MKTVLLIAALSSSLLVTAQFTNPSKTFKLVLRSTNATLDGTSTSLNALLTTLLTHSRLPDLGACHNGAAIEDLCFVPRTVDTHAYMTPFNHNVSVSTNTNSGAANEPGILTYQLNQWSSAMTFSPFHNMDVPLFGPGNSSFSTVWFNDVGAMYLPVDINGVQVPVENWWVCWFSYMYTRERLVWSEGSVPVFSGGEPDPHCQKVRVQREFVE
jgi:hypothetical protein